MHFFPMECKEKTLSLQKSTHLDMKISNHLVMKENHMQNPPKSLIKIIRFQH